MRKLYLKSGSSEDYKNWLSLLEREGIKGENTIQDTFGIYEDDRLIATASRFQNIIKCVAIDSAFQGTNVFNELITHLYNEVLNAGFSSCYVYTKKSAKKAFTYVGFKELEQVDNKLYFMENASSGFEAYLNNLGKQKVEGERIAAIVMNANPFTKGHLFLVTKASEENDVVHLFVLSEDISVFSGKDRLDLVKKGTAHLKNVYIHETSSYMVSAATFPSYFLKEDDNITEIQARLDARLFKNHIAKVLGINTRYVGSEPFSVATNIYNNAMKKEFESAINLKVFERIGIDEEIVSASRVRELLEQGDIEAACKLVPPPTCEFFHSEKGAKVIEKIKQSAN
ncbi:[citrate (pro-3S)-lyase] ligase [Tyzzerella sp. OttesenSCG-928-J15]|nr:[citrate (pro-3S)-lyase] ligase [Tyzzerella sp. OttesenSCG-928-J15]